MTKEWGNHHQRPYVMKTDPSSFLVFLGITCGPLFIISIILIFKDPSAWPVLCISSSLLAILMTWLGAFKLILYEDMIIYRTLFSKKTIMFANVYKIQIHVGLDRESIIKNAFYRLIIHERGQAGNKIAVINMKSFRLNDLAFLIESIIQKAPSVQVDIACQKLVEKYKKIARLPN